MIRVLALVGAFALGLFHPGSSLAQTTDDPVIATVNGDAIRNSDMTMFYDSLPSQYREVPMVSLYDQLIEGLIESRVLAQAARQAGLMDDPQVKRRLAFVTNDMLQQTYLNQLLAEQITEPRMRAEYDATIGAQPGEEEVSARHILLEDEAAARAVIEALAAGGDFVTLAQTRSTGPSAPSGGDLGYFTKDQMVAPFSEAAFALNPGEYTVVPVKTQFGWHVIKVEDRRLSAPPSFEDSQAEISRQMAKDYVFGLMEKLRESAEISRFDQPDQTAQGAPAAPVN
jgi:peptidyl-prolyl cis-trans isomerase C